MHFKYAESPKEKLKVYQIDEIEYAQDVHPKGKQIEIKKTTQNLIDMRHLIHIKMGKRIFCFSAHNRADQRMWISGFEVFFQLKTICDLIKNK